VCKAVNVHSSHRGEVGWSVMDAWVCSWSCFKKRR